MNADKTKPQFETRIIGHDQWLGIAVACVLLIVGALFAWWSVRQTDLEMRAALLQRTRLIAESLNIDRIKAFTGTAADLDNPSYLRIKDQFAAVCSATPQCRFLYLLGRRDDGTIFSYLDSGPVEARAFSSPGDLTEVSESLRTLFARHTAMTEGPISESWGTRVSGLIPIHNPQAELFGLATADDARAMVRQAIDYYRKHGRERLLEEINNPQGAFRKGDLYAFVYDSDMTMLAHPVKPELVGQNLLHYKDWAGGKYFRQEIKEVALSRGAGWVDYEYENPVNKQRDLKTTYVERVDNLIICTGSYKGTGAPLAVLGMDIDAGDWGHDRALALIPAGLLELALAIILMTVAWLLYRGSRTTHGYIQYMHQLGTVLVLAVGLVLTLLASWMAHVRETNNLREAFVQLASSRTELIASTLKNLRDRELEGLAHYYASSENITPAEFQAYSAYLTKNSVISAWQWIPVVKAAERDLFEAASIAAGHQDFAIWQRDGQGQRVAATHRDIYYPVSQSAPLADTAQMLGYDAGSSPLSRAALIEASQTRLATATEPLALTEGADTAITMEFYRPVFDELGSNRLRGYAAAVLRMSKLIGHVGQDEPLLLELSLLSRRASPESLARSWGAENPPAAGLSLTRPVLAFGKIFGVTAHAGPMFRQMHPIQAGRWTILAGCALTLACAFVTRAILQRREGLERLVVERTHELQRSEERFRAIFDNAPYAIVINSLDDGRYLEGNKAFLESRGIGSEDLRHLKTESIVLMPQGEEEDFIEMLVRTGSVRDREAVIVKKDGSQGHVIYSSVLLEFTGHQQILSMTVDVTARKQAEKALKESEVRFRSLFKMAPMPLANIAMDGRMLEVNNSFTQMFGYTLDEMPTLDEAWRLFFPDSALRDQITSKWKKALAQAIANDTEMESIESTVRSKDGTLHTGVFLTVLVKDILIVGFLDLTERREKESSLQRSMELLRATFNATTDGILVVNKDLKITHANQQFYRMWSIPPDLQQTDDDALLRDYVKDQLEDPAAFQTLVTSLYHSQRQQVEEIGLKGGRVFECYSAPMLLDGKEIGRVWDFRDISERKQAEDERNKLQEQLLQSQKLEAVGVLAGGIAHDFNNMLAAIIGYADLTLAAMDPDDQSRKNLDRILDAANRSADITRQLLAFARKQTIAPVVVDLNESMESILTMIRRLIGENIELAWLPCKQRCTIKIDPSQLDQILVNLCVNARDAIADVGRVTIATGKVAFDDAYCTTHAGFIPGEYVFLSVSDDGCGIDKETLKHIFEPFFTTKGLGQGTGMGLATVYGIVKQNEGFINVYSEAGLGTTFTVYLPSQATEAAQFSFTELAEPNSTGHETILLVEDDPMILEMTMEMLESLGYSVLPAGTPGEALRLAQEHTGEIHMLMTDVVMPEMNGRDLALQLLDHYPSLRRLFMSGYTANVIAHNGVLDDGMHFIQKPFTLRYLAAKIREVLDH